MGVQPDRWIWIRITTQPESLGWAWASAFFKKLPRWSYCVAKVRNHRSRWKGVAHRVLQGPTGRKRGSCGAGRLLLQPVPSNLFYLLNFLVTLEERAPLPKTNVWKSLGRKPVSASHLRVCGPPWGFPRGLGLVASLCVVKQPLSSFLQPLPSTPGRATLSG